MHCARVLSSGQQGYAYRSWAAAFGIYAYLQVLSILGLNSIWLKALSLAAQSTSEVHIQLLGNSQWI